MSVCPSSHPRRPSVGGNACLDVRLSPSLSDLALFPFLQPIKFVQKPHLPRRLALSVKRSLRSFGCRVKRLYHDLDLLKPFRAGCAISEADLKTHTTTSASAAAPFLADHDEHTSSPVSHRSFIRPLLLLMIGEFLSPPLLCPTILTHGPESVIKKDLLKRDRRPSPDSSLGPYESGSPHCLFAPGLRNARVLLGGLRRLEESFCLLSIYSLCAEPAMCVHTK